MFNWTHQIWNLQLAQLQEGWLKKLLHHKADTVHRKKKNYNINIKATFFLPKRKKEQKIW